MWLFLASIAKSGSVLSERLLFLGFFDFPVDIFQIFVRKIFQFFEINFLIYIIAKSVSKTKPSARRNFFSPFSISIMNKLFSVFFIAKRRIPSRLCRMSQ